MGWWMLLNYSSDWWAVRLVRGLAIAKPCESIPLIAYVYEL
jgi:hypothetical protein